MPFPETETYLAESSLFPFCKGCGHTHVLRKLNDALVSLHLDPSDVCLVTDIGCIGLADALFESPHTVHTTHGRSTAFAAGIAMADSILAAGKLKTIVLIGDGGAMIGLLHLVSGALLNIDLTVLLCNNSLFGMTGGQHSALSPVGFKTPTSPAGNMIPPLDICSVVSTAHAGLVTRAIATDPDLAGILAKAITFRGFSLVEIDEICPEHGIPRNPESGKNLRRTLEEQGLSIGKLAGDPLREDFGTLYRTQFPATIANNNQGGKDTKDTIEVTFESALKKQEGIIIAGSAGERVQSTARILCTAAAMSGLYCTQKNDNPVTQGSGFSLSEVIISPRPILYTAIERPAVIIVASRDGLSQLISMNVFGSVPKETLILADEELVLPETAGQVIRHPFRKESGPKKAALAALGMYVDLALPFPVRALHQATGDRV